MKKNVFFSLLVIILALDLVGCDIDDNEDIDWNNEYLKLAYDKNYKYPTGFYQDEAIINPEYCSPNKPGYRSFYYLHRTNINSKDEWIPLYTSSKEVANEWFNIFSVNAKWVWNDNFVLEKENIKEKIFEFIVVDKNSSYSPYTTFVRVHNSDYFVPQNRIERYPYDNQPKEYDIGVYNGEISVIKVKELVEYLWFLETYQIANYKVKKTEISEVDENIEINIKYLFIMWGDWDMRDIVYVYNTKYSLNKETKVLQFIERDLIDQVYGKMN
jgi:hypothetical protein